MLDPHRAALATSRLSFGPFALHAFWDISGLPKHEAPHLALPDILFKADFVFILFHPAQGIMLYATRNVSKKKRNAPCSLEVIVQWVDKRN